MIQFNHYLKCFIYGCVAYALYCFGYATYAYFKPVYTDLYGVLYNLGSNYYYYSYLSSVIHPSYTAMYTIVALLAIRYLNQQKNIYLNFTWLSIIVLLTTYVFFLSSKAGWIGLGFTYFIFIFDLLKSSSYFKIIFIVLTLIGFFFLINVYFAPQYASRIPKMQSIENAIKGKDKNNKPSTTGTDGSGSRIFVWKASLEVIKENLPLGAGTGDSRDKLMEKYLEKKMDTEYKFALNSHNQFLNTTLSLGILGFLSLFICFWIPFNTGLKFKALFLINFTIVVIINLLFESMFERQSGIIFYVF
ncbi:MAG: O-antigen ligase family protein, partial [Bacteroidia bacterium]|nr:O-antigen ligase family protein [Bacteroidia bacterium]